MPARAIGESCLLWSVGRGPHPAHTRRVHRLYHRLQTAAAERRVVFRDAVPAYDSLAVHFDPLNTDVAALRALVDGLIESENEPDPPGADRSANPDPQASAVTLPVVYDGVDLTRVADHAGLSVADVVARHAGPTYVVAAIGFLPHFPYLLGLDPALATPRRASPRTRVPAGAVAIGGDQTGVYPRASPGGWNLIGTTDPNRLTALRPGDRVDFAPTDPPR